MPSIEFHTSSGITEEKRRIVKSNIHRANSAFLYSRVIDYQELWRRCLAAAVCGDDTVQIEGQLRPLNFLNRSRWEVQWISVDKGLRVIELIE